MKPAVFLDRDGTIVEEVGYLNRLDKLSFFPCSIDAIRVLGQAGLLVVVVTNQAGVAQGYFDEQFVRDTHARVDERVRGGRARIDGYYYCPHHPNAKLEQYRVACDCRKPKPGMIRQAARDLDIDVARSFVVGDRWLDVEMGREVGATTILVTTGYGLGEDDRPEGVEADLVAANLMEAAGWILRRTRGQG